MSAWSDLFRGTLVLAATRWRTLLWLPLGALALALMLGLGARLDGTHPEKVGEALTLAALGAAFITPFIAAAGLTLGLSAQAGGASRHDELALLPIGRLALPAATLLIGVTLLALGSALTVLGLHLTLGVDRLLEGLRASGVTAHPGLGALVLVGLFTHFHYMLTIGPSPAGLVVLWPLVTLAARMAGEGMGYPAEALDRIALAWGACLCATLLVLSFALHLLSPTNWATTRGKTPGSRLARGFLVALSTLCVAAFFGPGTPTLVALALGALWVWRAPRRSGPPRPDRPRSAAVVAIATTTLVSAPLLLGLAVADQACVLAERRGDGASRRWSTWSPDFSRVAYELRAGHDGRGRRWVVVEDGRGGRLVLPTRFGDLPSRGAWSTDGRWLAVHDEALGRCDVGRTTLDGLGGPMRSLDARLCAIALHSIGQTFIVDATTGDVSAVAPRSVVPGWRSPDDLVHVDMTIEGRPALEDGRGRRLVLDGARGWPRIVAYEDGVPILVLEDPSALDMPEHVTGRGLSPLGLLRWTDAGLAPVDLSGAWMVHPRDTSDAPGKTRRARRGDVQVEVAGDDVVAVLEDAIVFASSSGIERVALPGGERTLLVAWQGAAAPARVHDALESTRLLVGGRDRWFALDLVAGTCVPRDLGGLSIEALSNGVALARDETGAWAIDPDGTRRRAP